MEPESFEDFCRDMHAEHLYEEPRMSNYKFLGKTYNQYVRDNFKYLQREYERQIGKQARKNLDGSNNQSGLHSL